MILNILKLPLFAPRQKELLPSELKYVTEKLASQHAVDHVHGWQVLHHRSFHLKGHYGKEGRALLASEIQSEGPFHIVDEFVLYAQDLKSAFFEEAMFATRMAAEVLKASFDNTPMIYVTLATARAECDLALAFYERLVRYTQLPSDDASLVMTDTARNHVGQLRTLLEEIDVLGQERLEVLRGRKPDTMADVVPIDVSWNISFQMDPYPWWLADDD